MAHYFAEARAGNTASASVTLNIQIAALTVSASASPQANAAGWNKTNVTVSFQCTGGVAPVSCPASQVVSSEGQGQAISGITVDSIGQRVTTTATVSLDKTPPSLNITSPPGGANVSTGQITIQGLVSDAVSGVSSVTCGSVVALVTGTAFSCQVSLSLGSNTIAVSATDVAGNAASSSIALIYATPIAVQITNPTPLQLFSVNPITVTGTVSDPTSMVTVGGVSALMNNGIFTASGIVLSEGKNLLTASATSSSGGVGADTVTVYLDTTPPTVHIDSPTTGAVVTNTQIDVSGNVNDMVSGTVNGDQVSVVVNGVTAAVSNRTFIARGVLLVPGLNTITAVATDRAGNTSQHQVTATLQQLAGQSIAIISGNAQSAPINTLLPQPLVVQATDSLGRSMANVPLTFSVLKSDGIILAGQQKGRQLTLQTGANGQASVQFQVGSRNVAGGNQVAVAAPGFLGQVVFSEDTTVGPALQIHTVSGESQTGAVGVALPEPLVAIVFDAGGNPVANVSVTFTVQSGGGLFGTSASLVQNTDGDGKAYATLVLGQQEGVNNNAVSAAFAGMSGQPASFISSGVVPGPVANTTVTGLVLDDAEQPIPNATASIKGTNLSARTNTQGQFTIANVPVGDIVLYIDGSTSTSSYTFPTLSFQMATIPGISNTLGHPIYLPAIDTNNSQVVGGDQPVQLTMTDVPGLVYTVAPNSVTFPDGSHVGILTLSQVHGDRVPMTPPNGSSPRLVGTLQPAGVVFNPPIQVQFPNTDGLVPGQVEEIFSFHHDIEQFVVEGTARVSEDGSVVVSDPGFGLTVSGWHGGGGGNPQPPTCGDGCSTACTINGHCFLGICFGGDDKKVTDLLITGDKKGKDLVKVGQMVSFNALVTSQNCSNLTYNWNFGDGGTDTSSSPTHSYTNPGTYTVNLTVNCDSCSSATKQDQMEVDVFKVKITSPTQPATYVIPDPPVMPAVDATAVINGVDPDPTFTSLFNWHIDVDFADVTGTDFSLTEPEIPPQPTQGGILHTTFLNLFAGGFLSLKACSQPSGAAQEDCDDTKGLDLMIIGTDPSSGSIASALGGDIDLARIACVESGWHQFINGGQPVQSTTGAAGILQIIFHRTRADYWSWPTNIGDGSALLASSRSFAQGVPTSWRNGVRRIGFPAHPNATDGFVPNDQGLGPDDAVEREAIHRYNNGTSLFTGYWQWDDNQQIWLAQPIATAGGDVNYVDKVLSAPAVCR